MAGENKISISYSPPPLSFIHRPTVSMIETEGGPVNSDRFLRRNEITLKRKIALSSVIKPEYRSLCYASGTGTDEFVFGQNLENQLKEINVTSKLKTKKQQNGQSINSQTNYQTRGGFLGRGRGQRAQPYQRHQSQQRGKKTHH